MPPTPLKASVSLWSADLLNLEREIRRVDPYADLYHIDVADGTCADLLLFFPDLVNAVRALTERPLEVHLITRNPQRWIGPFAEAGADRIIFYLDATEEPQRMIHEISQLGLKAAISLAPDIPIEAIEPHLRLLDLVCVVGTDIGVKGVDDIAEGTCQKITALTRMRESKNLSFEIEADGAIRRHTVPRLREAGVDIVVPGSLIFNGDCAATSRWLRAL